jgi:hypothetical protein
MKEGTQDAVYKREAVHNHELTEHRLKRSVPVKAFKTTAKKDSRNKTSSDQIMELLGMNYARGVTTVHKDVFASQLKIVPKTVANILTKLKNANKIGMSRGNISLTEEGVQGLGELAKQPGTDEEIHKRLKADLKKRQVELFDLIADGREYSKEDIARKLGYDQGAKTKAFMNLIGDMKNARKILIYPTKDTIQLKADVCFLPPKKD